jgi:hypothetical protein
MWVDSSKRRTSVQNCYLATHTGSHPTNGRPVALVILKIEAAIRSEECRQSTEVSQRKPQEIETRSNRPPNNSGVLPTLDDRPTRFGSRERRPRDVRERGWWIVPESHVTDARSGCDFGGLQGILCWPSSLA